MLHACSFKARESCFQLTVLKGEKQPNRLKPLGTMSVVFLISPNEGRRGKWFIMIPFYFIGGKYCDGQGISNHINLLVVISDVFYGV